ncbi:MAG: SPOR domain-containing protein [Pseudomonadota bacterium]|nr:SPOR domain-containing protein [Pseudomonadota bacterium]
MIEAEYDEIDGSGSELDLSEEDSLPWLEADEEDDSAGSLDTAQLVGFLALLGAVLFGVLGTIYFVSQSGSSDEMVADGSTIEAPEGPYKTAPDDPGGKEFAGTGDVAPGVGQGQAPDSQMASNTGAASGDQDLNIAMPSIGGGDAATGQGGGASGSGTNPPRTGAAREIAANGGSTSQSGVSGNSGSSSASSGGVGVQLAAYSSRSRAEQGWRDLKGRTSALSGFKHRVVEGQVDIGTVYRLQAVAANRSAADKLCATLKRQGLDCAVKP